jgi:hypothetical protein
MEKIEAHRARDSNFAPSTAVAIAVSGRLSTEFLDNENACKLFRLRTQLTSRLQESEQGAQSL